MRATDRRDAHAANRRFEASEERVRRGIDAIRTAAQLAMAKPAHDAARAVEIGAQDGVVSRVDTWREHVRLVEPSHVEHTARGLGALVRAVEDLARTPPQDSHVARTDQQALTVPRPHQIAHVRGCEGRGSDLFEVLATRDRMQPDDGRGAGPHHRLERVGDGSRLVRCPCATRLAHRLQGRPCVRVNVERPDDLDASGCERGGERLERGARVKSKREALRGLGEHRRTAREIGNGVRYLQAQLLGDLFGQLGFGKAPDDVRDRAVRREMREERHVERTMPVSDRRNEERPPVNDGQVTESIEENSTRGWVHRHHHGT
jgi:hypothetical protein